ncbi:CPBP family intramembrane glutamic endopeptidase [Nocardioides sp.]|uniref:CPBP family intramembrane glutamic endopeptidase n=1 Tax=Nocardioides sp. TaxID=35761 RepID=UPI00261A8683|nr:CPBP family intramembrane glutamic endopeptidase [Nocardioides sp.]
MTGSLEYHEINRAHGVAGWRTVLGTVLLLILFLWLPVVVSVPFLAGLTIDGASQQRITDFFNLDPVTPGNLAYLDLGLATAIGSAMFVAWLIHGHQAPRWLLSVAGRIRWRWFLTCLGLAVITLVVTLAVSAILPAGSSETQMSGPVHDFTRQTFWFVVVIVVLTPFQAAGEEFAFRGYLTQAWGGWASLRSRRWGRVVAVVVPALFFALAHGLGQDVPVFFDRFAFGVVAGILVIATGGLEAGLAMHVLNNLVAFGVALAFGDITTTLTEASGSWWMIVSTLTQSLVFAALVLWAARRQNVALRFGPQAPPL